MAAPTYGSESLCLKALTHAPARCHPDGPDRERQHRRGFHLRHGAQRQARGHKLWHYHPRQLTLRDGKAIARARPMSLRRKKGNHFTLGDEEVIELSTLDVILMRQDPPFDMAYITATHILETVHPEDPGGERPGPCAQRAGEAVRHPVRRADAADPDHLRPRRRSWRSATSTRTSSSSRCSATAAPACSTSSRATRTSASLLEMFTQFYREPIRCSATCRRCARATSASS